MIAEPASRRRRVAFRLAATAAGVALALLAGEIGLRILDGYSLTSLALTTRAAAPGPDRPNRSAAELDQAALRYASAVKRAPAVDFAWYLEDPPVIRPYPTPPWVWQRLQLAGNETRLFEFNRAFLADRICRDVATTMFGTQPDFLYFDPIGASPYPTYRHLRRLSAPGWFTTNSFGWRGPDVALDKPPQTIRVAFVGASTTVDESDFPFSYPEFIGQWLNLWAGRLDKPFRFDVINAGRSGINSHSIAAVVRDELLPLEPDLVVYYEGANQFFPPTSIGYRLGRLYARPRVDGAHEPPGPSRSAMARRIRTAIDAWRGGDGSEPIKPIQWIRMPGVDEANPDSRSRQLPVELPEIVSDLEGIHASLAGIGGELVMTSFVWMVTDGMKLELPRQLPLFNYLNRDYWPASYATMRRLADLQNRVFRDFARRHRLPFIDLAGAFPLDSNLFADGVHLRYAASRLKAWIVFQDLLGVIDARVAAGALPRPMAHPGARHPAFGQPTPRTISRAAVLASCQR